MYAKSAFCFGMVIESGGEDVSCWSSLLRCSVFLLDWVMHSVTSVDVKEKMALSVSYMTTKWFFQGGAP